MFSNRSKIYRRTISATIAVAFGLMSILPPGISYAQVLPMSVLNLPAPGTLVLTSPGFSPAILQGIKIHPDNPLRFDFIVNPGEDRLEGEALNQETLKLTKYFLAALTIPEDQQWVNLSPYEKDRMIPESLGETEMGRDLLAQDYLLKQITASLLYPEDELGKKFWDKIYKIAKEKYGTTEIPVNTFNKVWIVPDYAVVHEYEGGAIVGERYLKVMLEEDYLAAQSSGQGSVDSGHNGLTTDHRSLTTQIVRELIIPELEREVNEGENFATLRQIFNSMILATWYKAALKESFLGKVYVNQNKTKGVEVKDKKIKEKIYEQYLKSFKLGAYNYIKEDLDPETQEVIPRKYFSGGFSHFSKKNLRRKIASSAIVTKAFKPYRVFKIEVMPEGIPESVVDLVKNAALPMATVTSDFTLAYPKGADVGFLSDGKEALDFLISSLGTEEFMFSLEVALPNEDFVEDEIEEIVSTLRWLTNNKPLFELVSNVQSIEELALFVFRSGFDKAASLLKQPRFLQTLNDLLLGSRAKEDAINASLEDVLTIENFKDEQWLNITEAELEAGILKVYMAKEKGKRKRPEMPIRVIQGYSRTLVSKLGFEITRKLESKDYVIILKKAGFYDANKSRDKLFRELIQKRAYAFLHSDLRNLRINKILIHAKRLKINIKDVDLIKQKLEGETNRKIAKERSIRTLDVANKVNFAFFDFNRKFMQSATLSAVPSSSSPIKIKTMLKNKAFVEKLLDPEVSPLNEKQIYLLKHRDELNGSEKMSYDAIAKVLKSYGSVQISLYKTLPDKISRYYYSRRWVNYSSTDEIEKDIQNILSMPIEQTELHSKTRRALSKAGFETLGEFIGHSRQEIIRNHRSLINTLSIVEDYLDFWGVQFKEADLGFLDSIRGVLIVEGMAEKLFASDTLTEREKIVIKHSVPLFGERFMITKEISELPLFVSLSYERVRQIEQRAYQKVRIWYENPASHSEQSLLDGATKSLETSLKEAGLPQIFVRKFEEMDVYTVGQLSTLTVQKIVEMEDRHNPNEVKYNILIDVRAVMLSFETHLKGDEELTWEFIQFLMELSERARNAFKYWQINSFESFKRFDLYKFEKGTPGMNKRTFDEIVDRMKEEGISLGVSPGMSGTPASPSARSLPKKSEEIKRLAVSISPEDILTKNVDALTGLGVKAKRALKQLEVKTVEQLTLKTEGDFSKLRSFGSGALNEIKSALAEMGLSLSLSSVSLRVSLAGVDATDEEFEKKVISKIEEADAFIEWAKDFTGYRTNVYTELSVLLEILYQGIKQEGPLSTKHYTTTVFDWSSKRNIAEAQAKFIFQILAEMGILEEVGPQWGITDWIRNAMIQKPEKLRSLFIQKLMNEEHLYISSGRFNKRSSGHKGQEQMDRVQKAVSEIKNDLTGSSPIKSYYVGFTTDDQEKIRSYIPILLRGISRALNKWGSPMIKARESQDFEMMKKAVTIVVDEHIKEPMLINAMAAILMGDGKQDDWLSALDVILSNKPTNELNLTLYSIFDGQLDFVADWLKEQRQLSNRYFFNHTDIARFFDWEVFLETSKKLSENVKTIDVKLLISRIELYLKGRSDSLFINFTLLLDFIDTDGILAIQKVMTKNVETDDEVLRYLHGDDKASLEGLHTNDRKIILKQRRNGELHVYFHERASITKQFKEEIDFYLNERTRASSSPFSTLDLSFDRSIETPLFRTPIQEYFGEEESNVKGGIDFNPAQMNLQIKRDARGVPLPLPLQTLEMYDVEGFFPVIIQSAPVNIPLLINLFDSDSDDEDDREITRQNDPLYHDRKDRMLAREPELVS